MSDIMLLGVLRMPLPEGCECLSNPLSQVAQFVDRGRQAADLIEQQAAEIERLRALLRDARPLVADSIGDSFSEDNNGWSQERAVLAGIDAALAEGKET